MKTTAQLADLARRHTLTFTPGTPAYDLLWEVLSAHSENLGDIVDEDESKLSPREREAQRKDRAALAVTDDLVGKLGAFMAELAQG